MTWWRPWRRKVEESDDAVHAAEVLRDRAQEQHRRVEAITPRVDAAAASLRQLRTENHFGPMVESILRGAK